jgi:two-component system, response regulator PdtaR
MESRKKILIVEDEFIIAMLIEKQITRLGYNVVDKVTSGAKAIEAVKTYRCDLILMDIKIIGDIDGIETMREIRKFSEVPVIYITGNSDPVTKQKAFETGPAGYIIKPIETDTLRNAINLVFGTN